MTGTVKIIDEDGAVLGYLEGDEENV